MYRVECYAAVRRSVYVEGWSERASARRFGLARETVRKMLLSIRVSSERWWRLNHGLILPSR